MAGVCSSALLSAGAVEVFGAGGGGFIAGLCRLGSLGATLCTLVSDGIGEPCGGVETEKTLSWLAGGTAVFGGGSTGGLGAGSGCGSFLPLLSASATFATIAP